MLLVSFAQTAKSTRALLTPACFSHCDLALDTYDVPLIPSCPSEALKSFHSRVLRDSRLTICWGPGLDVQQVLHVLDFFPTCRSLNLSGFGDDRPLTDPDLHSLLRHPTISTRDELILFCFTRHKAEDVSIDGERSQVDARATRGKRKRDSTLAVSSRKRPFDLADIRLPALTSFDFRVLGRPLYNGGAAFLTAHTALTELNMSTVLVSIDELAAVFEDPAALPLLSRFGLYDHRSKRERVVYDLSLLLTALAATVVTTSGKVRPMKWLNLHPLTTNNVFGIALLMRGLTHLHVQQAMAGWLQEWMTGMQKVLSPAFPDMQQCSVHTSADARAAATDMSSFLHSVAAGQLELLDITTGGGVTCDTASMSQLARCRSCDR